MTTEPSPEPDELDQPRPRVRDPRLVPSLRDVPLVADFKVLDPAILLDVLGTGGMGTVYRGYHRKLEIDVAVKCLDPLLAAKDPAYVRRFQREARLAASIKHHNVVGVQDVLDSSGLHYLVMEFVLGETVRQRVRRAGRLDETEAKLVLLGAANGLGFAHQAGIVHRDMKPDNLMVTVDGVVKVTDLGLARIGGSGDGGSLGSVASSIMGTPQYMPPEQWDSAKVGPPADVWALGATLYFLLTGEHAIQPDSLTRISRRIQDRDFPDIADVRPDVSPALRSLLQRCVHRDPTQRFGDAKELARELRQIITDEHDVMLADGRWHNAAGDPPRRPDRAALGSIRQFCDEQQRAGRVPSQAETAGSVERGTPPPDASLRSMPTVPSPPGSEAANSTAATGGIISAGELRRISSAVQAALGAWDGLPQVAAEPGLREILDKGSRLRRELEAEYAAGHHLPARQLAGELESTCASFDSVLGRRRSAEKERDRFEPSLEQARVLDASRHLPRRWQIVEQFQLQAVDAHQRAMFEHSRDHWREARRELSGVVAEALPMRRAEVLAFRTEVRKLLADTSLERSVQSQRASELAKAHFLSRDQARALIKDVRAVDGDQPLPVLDDQQLLLLLGGGSPASTTSLSSSLLARSRPWLWGLVVGVLGLSLLVSVGALVVVCFDDPPSVLQGAFVALAVAAMIGPGNEAVRLVFGRTPPRWCSRWAVLSHAFLGACLLTMAATCVYEWLPSGLTDLVSADKEEIVGWSLFAVAAGVISLRLFRGRNGRPVGFACMETAKSTVRVAVLLLLLASVAIGPARAWGTGFLGPDFALHVLAMVCWSTLVVVWFPCACVLFAAALERLKDDDRSAVQGRVRLGPLWVTSVVLGLAGSIAAAFRLWPPLDYPLLGGGAFALVVFVALGIASSKRM